MNSWDGSIPNFIVVQNSVVYCPLLETDYSGYMLFERKRNAVIDAGVVHSVEYLSEYELNRKNVFVPELASMTFVKTNKGMIGDSYADGVFTTPTPVPQSVTRQQMMAVLMITGLITEAEWLSCYQTGTLPEIVSNAINTLPSDAAKLVAKVKWVEFSEAKRWDSVVLLLAAHANLSEEQVDDIFIQAAQL